MVWTIKFEVSDKHLHSGKKILGVKKLEPMSAADNTASSVNAEERDVATEGNGQKENLTVEQTSNVRMENSSLGEEVSCPSHLDIPFIPLLLSKDCDRPSEQGGIVSSTPICNTGDSHSKVHVQGEYQYKSRNAVVLGCDGGGQDKVQSNRPRSNAPVCVTEVGDLQKTPILSDKQTKLSLERANQQERLCDTEIALKNQTGLDVNDEKDFQTKRITAKTDGASNVIVHKINNQEMFTPKTRDSAPKEAAQMSLTEIGKETVERVLALESNRKTSIIAEMINDPSECMPVILNVRGNATDLDVTDEVNQTNDGEDVERGSKISTSSTSFPSQPEGPLEKTFDNLNTEAGNMSQKDCITTIVSKSNTPADTSCAFSRKPFHASSVSSDTVSEMTLNNSATQSTKPSVSNNSRKKHSLPPSIYVNRVSGSQGPDSHSTILSNICDLLSATAKGEKGMEPVKKVQPNRVYYSLLKPTKSPPSYGTSQTTSTITSSTSYGIISTSSLSSGRINSGNPKLGDLDPANPSTSLKVLNPPTTCTILVSTQRTRVTTSSAGGTEMQAKQPPRVIIRGDDQNEQSSSTQIGQPEPESPLDSYDLLSEFRGMNRQEILASGLLRVTKKTRSDLSKQHVCFICGDEFHTREFLQFHLTRNVFVLTYFCSVCNKLCTFHNKCTFVQHVLEEFVKREESPLKIETSFMKLEPYLPPDAKTKSHNLKSQSVVPSDHQSTTGFPNNEMLSTTVVSCDQRISTAVVPCVQRISTTFVPSDHQSTTVVPCDQRVSTTLVPSYQRVSTTVVPSDQRVSTTVVPSDQRVSTTLVYSDQRLSTTVVYTDQRLSTTVVPIDQRLLTRVVTSDQRISTNIVPSKLKISTFIVPTNPKISTSVIPSNRKITSIVPRNHRLSTSVVPSDHQLSTTVVPSDHQLSTTVVPNDHQPSTTVVPSEHQLSTTVVLSDHQLSTTVPSDHQPSTTVVRSNHQLSTIVPSDHQLSTTVVPTDQRLSTTVGASDQRLSTTVLPGDQGSSTTVVPTDQRLSTAFVSSAQRPSTTVVSSDHGPSTTLSPGAKGLSTTVVSSDQRPLTAVVQSRIWRSTKNNCPFCKTDFLTFSGLKSHFQRMSNQTYFCHICQMELFNQCSLSAHSGIHSVEEKKDLVTCPECGETLQYSQDFRLLFEHLDSCGHFNVWYQVACVCGEIFQSIVTLKEHFLEDHLQVRYQCNECFLLRPSMYLLYLHYKNKHQHRMCAASVILQCSLCKKLFDNPTALRAHVNREVSNFKRTKQKVYQCIICQGIFQSASDLNAHQERFHIHKPKRCTLCCGLFMGRQNLVTHLVSKSCPKKFPNLLHLCLDSPSKRERPVNHSRYAKLFEVKCLDAVPAGVGVSVQQNVITSSTVNDSQSKATVPITICSLTQPQTEKNSENYQFKTSNKSVLSERSSSTSKRSAYDRSKHQCHLCKICLTGSHNFNKHMSHHKATDSQTGRSHCVVCKKRVTEISISSHMEEHQNHGVIVCTLCHRRDFPSLNLARDHSKNWCYYKEVNGWGEDFLKEKLNPPGHTDADSMEHSPNNKDSVNDSRDLSVSNSRSESEPLVFPCLMCGLAFSSKSAKDDHVSRVHDGTKTFFLCLVCKGRGTRKAFNKKQKVLVHISRKHRITDATAISKLILEEELNISSGQVILSDVSSQESLDEPPPKRLRQEAEGTFLCGKCGFSNAQRDIFEQHIKIHNPEGEPQCPECGLCFTVSAALKKHLFAVHRIKGVEEYMKCRGIEEEIIEDLPSDDDYDVEVEALPSVSVIEECVERPLKSWKPPKRKSISMNKIDSSWECNVCYKKFTSELVLKSHMRNHGMAFIRSRRDRNRDQNYVYQLGST